MCSPFVARARETFALTTIISFTLCFYPFEPTFCQSGFLLRATVITPVATAVLGPEAPGHSTILARRVSSPATTTTLTHATHINPLSTEV